VDLYLPIKKVNALFFDIPIMKRNKEHRDRAFRKNLTFERALHKWPQWLDSIANGRKELRFRHSHPSLEEMINISKKVLKEMHFPSCTLLEIYWLCCVFANYETATGFKFDKLVLPDWFPSTLKDYLGCTINFKGKRIYPPEVWEEADRKFWFERDRLLLYLSPEERDATYEDYPYYPNRHFIFVLSDDHPVRKYVKMGRPITTKADGETMLE
jgi:hypothetical protein